MESHLGNNLRRGCAQEVCDELQLVDHIPAGKQGLAQQDLSKDAAYAPDVDGWRVLGKEGSAQLGSSVPAGCHIVRPEDGGWHVVEGRPGQAEIAHLQLAV